ncbi:MAG: cupredoxin domain-containing protein [Actinomycetota bacterium]
MIMKRWMIGLATALLVLAACTSGGEQAATAPPSPEPTETTEPSPSEEPSPSPEPSPSEEPTGGDGGPCSSGDEIEVEAENFAFDADCLGAPAGQDFTIKFKNRDPGPHNVSIYSDDTDTEQLFGGKIINGGDQITYRVDALDPGLYVFRCDVHPYMRGKFVVA